MAISCIPGNLCFRIKSAELKNKDIHEWHSGLGSRLLFSEWKIKAKSILLKHSNDAFNENESVSIRLEEYIMKSLRIDPGMKEKWPQTRVGCLQYQVKVEEK